MDTAMIIEIIKILAYVILGGLALWFQSNAKIKGKVSGVIAEAEDVYSDTIKSGGEKHEYVVNKLYQLIPAPMRLIFTKDMIAGIVDRTFDSIERYAKQQLDRVVDNSIKSNEVK